MPQRAHGGRHRGSASYRAALRPGRASDARRLAGVPSHDVAAKCEGLTDEQRKPLTDLTLSLHGLVRHMADVERGWFRCIAREGTSRTSSTTTTTRTPTSSLDDANWEADLARWLAECDAARAVAGCVAGSRLHPGPPSPANRVTALGLHPHDRGVRAAQRPRRPDPRAGRRSRGLVTLRPTSGLFAQRSPVAQIATSRSSPSSGRAIRTSSRSPDRPSTRPSPHSTSVTDSSSEASRSRSSTSSIDASR